jgi:hypothetical protein
MRPEPRLLAAVLLLTLMLTQAAPVGLLALAAALFLAVLPKRPLVRVERP